MRSRSVVTTLLTLTAGVAVSAVARRLAARRRAQISLARTAAAVATPAGVAPTPTPAPAAVPAVAVVPAETAADRQGVVLPFTRPVPVAPAQKATPARCGENGGRTKAGAPCAARATSGGRCHHHRVAA